MGEAKDWERHRAAKKQVIADRDAMHRRAQKAEAEIERLRDGLRAVMVGCEVLGDPFDPQHIAEMVLEKGHHAKPTKEAPSDG